MSCYDEVFCDTFLREKVSERRTTSWFQTHYQDIVSLCLWAGEWIKVLAASSDKESQIPGIHMARGKNLSLKAALWPQHM